MKWEAPGFSSEVDFRDSRVHVTVPEVCWTKQNGWPQTAAQIPSGMTETIHQAIWTLSKQVGDWQL